MSSWKKVDKFICLRAIVTKDVSCDSRYLQTKKIFKNNKALPIVTE